MSKQFTIKDELIHKITNQIDFQTKKGIMKYGHDLDDCEYDAYDWLEMANQELIDLAQYQQKEIRRQRKIIRKLRDKQ